VTAGPARTVAVVAAIGAYLSLSAIAMERYRERVPRVFQTRSNELFSRQPTYEAALDRFHWRWAPGYPTVLWVAQRARLRPDAVNLGLLWSSVAGMFLVARRRLRGTHAIWPTALFGVGSYLFYNFRQLSAEALFLPLSFLVYDGLARYATRPTVLRAVLVSAGVLALAFSRLLAIPWIGPVALAVFVAARTSRRSRVVHAGVLLAVVGAPVAGLFAHARAETGFWTGMDRRSWSARELDPSLAHWAERTGPVDQALRAAKVVWVDHLSPFRHATHEVISPPRGARKSVTPGPRRFHRSIDDPWNPGGLDLVLGVLAVTALGALVVGRRRLGSRLALSDPGVLSAALFGMHVVLTIPLWSMSNSDPLYSRYLLPAYPWLLLALFSGYAGLREAGAPLRLAMPLRALFFAAGIVQVVKVVGLATSSGSP
jgi:hypothetical protein